MLIAMTTSHELLKEGSIIWEVDESPVLPLNIYYRGDEQNALGVGESEWRFHRCRFLCASGCLLQASILGKTIRSGRCFTSTSILLSWTSCGRSCIPDFIENYELLFELLQDTSFFPYISEAGISLNCYRLVGNCNNYYISRFKVCCADISDRVF